MDSDDTTFETYPEAAAAYEADEGEAPFAVRREQQSPQPEPATTGVEDLLAALHGAISSHVAAQANLEQELAEARRRLQTLEEERASEREQLATLRQTLRQFIAQLEQR